MTEKFIVGPSPHVLGPKSVSSIMWDVVIALVPVCLVGILYFGLNALLILLISTVVAMAAEALVLRRSLKPASFLGDGSAAVTGLLVGLILPPSAPLWLVAVASAVAILLGKQVFGGLGNNIFNPALVGRAFVFMSWPVLMTTWHEPLKLSNWLTRLPADVISSATPLGGAEHGLLDLFTGQIGGSLGETSAAAILLGAVYLLLKGHIDWRAPGGCVGSAALIAAIFSLTEGTFSLEMVATQVMAGGLLFAAVFMITDMVTSPVTKAGRLIFGIGCGVITMVVRLYLSAPEGVTYAVLFMNAMVPLIDRFTVPKVFGEVKSQ